VLSANRSLGQAFVLAPLDHPAVNLWTAVAANTVRSNCHARRALRPPSPAGTRRQAGAGAISSGGFLPGAGIVPSANTRKNAGRRERSASRCCPSHLGRPSLNRHKLQLQPYRSQGSSRVDQVGPFRCTLVRSGISDAKCEMLLSAGLSWRNGNHDGWSSGESAPV
jgi:hypothetical protein